MCGIFAGSGATDDGILRSLGCFNEARGTDSSGIAWWTPKEGLRVEKKAVHPLVAFNNELFGASLEAGSAGVAIGHTRNATHGAVTDRNAHPFIDDGVAFAHNGVIHNNDKFGKYVVDSECLIHGIKKRDFEEYSGGIALVWIDDKGTLFAFRNGNPLWRGRKKDVLYLASDEDYLKNVGCTAVKELSEEHVYEIREGKIIHAKAVPSNKTFNTWDNKTTYYGRNNHAPDTEESWAATRKAWGVHDDDKHTNLRLRDEFDKNLTLPEIFKVKDATKGDIEYDVDKDKLLCVISRCEDVEDVPNEVGAISIHGIHYSTVEAMLIFAFLEKKIAQRYDGEASLTKMSLIERTRVMAQPAVKSKCGRFWMRHCGSCAWRECYLYIPVDDTSEENVALAEMWSVCTASDIMPDYELLVELENATGEREDCPPLPLDSPVLLTQSKICDTDKQVGFRRSLVPNPLDIDTRKPKVGDDAL